MKINPNLVDIYKKDTIEVSKLQQEYIKYFDSLTIRHPLSYYLTNQDISCLYKYAMSPSLNCNVKEKYRLIGELMKNRGFELLGGGTNRRAYRCTFENLVIKVATDQVGFTSNLREYPNQNVLKPFCTKIFCTDYSGTVSLSEQFIPFKTIEEFQKYSQDIFDILYYKLRSCNIGMEDVGTRSFKNWGYRNGYGPGLLDFPTMYVLDPLRKFCPSITDGHICGGPLDYDEGFNVIVCGECGKTHFASTLAKKDGDDIAKLLQAVGYQQKKNEKEQIAMRVRLVNCETNEVVREIEVGTNKSNYVDPTRRKEPVYYNNRQPQQQEKKINVRLTNIGVLDTATGEITSSDTSLTEAASKAIKEFNNPPVVVKEDFTPSNEDEAIKLIKDNTTDVEYFSNDKAKCLYREVSIATLDLEETDVSIEFDNIAFNHNTIISRLVDRIYPFNDNIDGFCYLINSVKNSVIFFKSVVNFFKSVIEKLSYQTEEKVGGEEYHYIYKDVFDIARKAIRDVMDDYLNKVSLIDGNLVYDKTKSFVTLNSCIEDMVRTFNTIDKASPNTDKTKSVLLYRDNTIFELSSFETTQEEPEPVEAEVIVEEPEKKVEPILSTNTTVMFDNYNTKPLTKRQKKKLEREAKKQKNHRDDYYYNKY